VSWKINSWWNSGEYKGKHRERLSSLTMGYMRDFYPVPATRQTTYRPTMEQAQQERPATA